jgi:sulfate adenylyltransferase, large subunit
MQSEKFPLVFAGHVDHGKSTIIGRLLSETGSLPEGKLEAIKNYCKLNSRPFEYAFLIDALKDEQSQGITIDTARVFFSTKKRDFVIIDAPGHIEFLKNMVTGASRAEAAFLVIAADEGVRENSRRHGYMLSILGIRQIVVLVNKMDLVGYSEEVFNKIRDEYSEFLYEIGIKPLGFVPVSGINGVNLSVKSPETPWYEGKTLYEFLDVFKAKEHSAKQPFRMFLQDIYRFTENGDNRRIYAGTVSSGTLNKGDEVVFYPSGKKSRVAKIESFSSDEKTSVEAGCATGFTLTEQIYATRGELVAKVGEPAPHSAMRFTAAVFWLGSEPLNMNRTYFMKIGTARTTLRLVEVSKLIDTSSLESKSGSEVGKFEAAECVFEAGKPIAFDLIGDNQETGRFVIVGDYEIRGGGIILKPLSEALLAHEITQSERERRFGHKAAVITVTDGNFAAELEKNLFALGAFVCYFPELDISQNLHELELLTKSGMLVIIKSTEDARDSLTKRWQNLPVMCLSERENSIEASLNKLRTSGILGL